MDILHSEKNNVSISGYDGYVGKNLVKILDIDDFSIIDIENLNSYGGKFIHLASNSDFKMDSKILSKNLNLDLNVFDKCHFLKKKLIYASTNNVYKKSTNLTINDEYDFFNFYGSSKIFSEILLKKIYNIDVCILRIADIFGVDQKHGIFFKHIEKSIKNDEVFEFSTEKFKIRSYIYIEELCDIIKYIINYDFFGKNIFNICHNNAISNKEILDILSVKYITIDSIKNYDIRVMEQNNVFDYNYQLDIKDALITYKNKIKKT